MSGWGKMNFELGEPCPLKPQPMSADLRSSEPEERENGGDLSRRHRRQCPSVTLALSALFAPPTIQASGSAGSGQTG